MSIHKLSDSLEMLLLLLLQETTDNSNIGTDTSKLLQLLIIKKWTQCPAKSSPKVSKVPKGQQYVGAAT